MRVRKRDSNGDYTFGQGSANFYINSADGVAQKVNTRLSLWKREWFLDKTVGMDWADDVLGYNTSGLRDIVIKAEILNTRDSAGNLLVTQINDYTGTYNATIRSYTVSGTITTIYSPIPVAFGPITL